MATEKGRPISAIRVSHCQERCRSPRTLNTPTSSDDVVTAIAISESDTTGGDIADTSEFSACHQVQSSNTPPVADDDSYSTNEDTALTMSAPGVLSNDTDVDGMTLTAVKVSDPAHGSVALNDNGSFTYTPAANYNGPDSFTYKANDGIGGLQRGDGQPDGERGQ